MSVVEDQHMVETLGSRRLDPSLRDLVRPRRLEWRSHLLNAEMPQAAVECGTIATVTVVKSETVVAIDPTRGTPLLAGHLLRR